MDNNRSFDYFKEMFFYLLLLAFSLAFLTTMLPFLIDIFMAVIMVMFFYKPHLKICKKIKSRSTAALISVSSLTIILAIPLLIIGIMVSFEAAGFYEMLKIRWTDYAQNISNETFRQKIAHYPWIENNLKNLDITSYKEKIISIGETVLQILLLFLKKIFFNLTSFVIHFSITIFLAYYLFLDGETLREKVLSVLPLRTKEEELFITNLTTMIKAIVVNTVLIGILEGAYGGLIFMVLGIANPFFWGVIMAILSMIPIVGASSVLFPAVIINLFQGEIAIALIILVFGVGGVFINQNIIKPRIDGKKSGLHPALLFLGSMGGIIWLGMIGVLIGPLILAMFVTIWSLFKEKYATQLSEHKNQLKE